MEQPDGLNILVIGSGGREDTLAWKFAQSPRVKKVFVAPGNDGMTRRPKVETVPLTDIDELIKFVKHKKITVTVVGPEGPLAAGVVDAFRAAGLNIFGPTQAAAQLESSKDFAKNFMVRHGIPTAPYKTFSDAQLAHDYVNEKGTPIVIKADGLAAGKGVVVAMTPKEAHDAIDMMLVHNKMGKAGTRVVIEDYIDGEEASIIVMVDKNRHVLPYAPSQDNKRLLDGDKGPNTGGTGANSPVRLITAELQARIMNEVVVPTINGMAEEGCPYTGFLYVGLIIDRYGKIWVLEFNCRSGDPETQVIMIRLQSDLVELMEHAFAGTLDQAEAKWDPRTAVGVVLMAEGYPNDPRKGDEISGLSEDTEDCVFFFAGVAQADGGRLKTAGGRVGCVAALGEGIRQAQHRAYARAMKIRWSGMHMRSDIGDRDMRQAR